MEGLGDVVHLGGHGRRRANAMKTLISRCLGGAVLVASDWGVGW